MAVLPVVMSLGKFWVHSYLDAGHPLQTSVVTVLHQGEGCVSVADALNTMYCAELTRSAHVKNQFVPKNKFSMSSA